MDVSSEPLYPVDHAPAADRKGTQKAARSLAATVAKLHGAAPLPAAVGQLLSATESDAFKIPEIVRILENDPGLAADLIRQVNSAGGARLQCKSIAQAVTMLGQKSLRSAAVAAGALEVFAGDEEPLAKAIARDARRSASVARALAPESKLGGDEMYMCALLHDVGKLMLLRGDDLDYPELLQKTAPEECHVEERERYGFDHALLAGHVLTAWKLPQPICRTVAWHHQPERAYASKGALPHMVALVRLADRLARLPDGATPEDATTAMTEMPTELEQLGLAPEVLARLGGDVVRALREPSDRDPRRSLPPMAAVASSPLQPHRPPPLPHAHESLFGAPWLAVLVFLSGALFGRTTSQLLPMPLLFGVGILVAFALLATTMRSRRSPPL